MTCFRRLIVGWCGWLLWSALADAASVDPLPPVAAVTNATPAAGGGIPGPSVTLLDDRQPLARGDRVSFRILEDREDPVSLVVSDAGELEVPYVGRLEASGKTCRRLAAEITPLLEQDYYRRATVVLAVEVLNRSRGKVYVMGEVRAAGPLDLPSDETLTLSKAILRAGGFTDFADRRKVRLTRRAAGVDEATEVRVVDARAILEQGQVERDVELRPGDFIFVAARAVRF